MATLLAISNQTSGRSSGVSYSIEAYFACFELYIPHNERMDEQSLVDIAQRFASARGITLWRVGFLAAGDGKFFARLKAGRTCTLRVARIVVQYLSDHWPAGLEWPTDILRPASRRETESEKAA